MVGGEFEFHDVEHALPVDVRCSRYLEEVYADASGVETDGLKNGVFHHDAETGVG